MRIISHQDPEFDNLKHLVMCLPASGASYLFKCLREEGRSVGHEAFAWDEGIDQIKICHGGRITSGIDIPEIEINHYLFRYQIHKQLNKQLWVLVRDPLKVAASLMWLCNSPFTQAIDRINTFYHEMFEADVMGYIHIDLPCKWKGFDSTKDYGFGSKTNEHNGGLIGLDLELMHKKVSERKGMRDFLTIRERLGY